MSGGILPAAHVEFLSVKTGIRRILSTQIMKSRILGFHN